MPVLELATIITVYGKLVLTADTKPTNHLRSIEIVGDGSVQLIGDMGNMFAGCVKHAMNSIQAYRHGT